MKLLVTERDISQSEESTWDYHNVSNQYIQDTITAANLDLEIVHISNLPKVADYLLAHDDVAGLVIPVGHGDWNTLEKIKEYTSEDKPQLFKQLEKENRIFEAWKLVPGHRENSFPHEFYRSNFNQRTQEVHKPFEKWVNELYNKTF